MPSEAFKGALPASIMDKLPFKHRFMARWYDAQAEIELHMPRNYRQAASYLMRKRWNQMVTSVPQSPREGQRYQDPRTGEVWQRKEGKWNLVRRT